ncbi:ABC transporter substrate-binding protein [Flavobacteriaceae bacterium 14752]|uniref:ABC transporter substrate-binding protein n=1 Tax=Mesohalobacter salilacus TaxID=2491711 RepID=UPI000F63FD64|nr:ABC transporter substrate-binding protein [Flavobacteriaceae bacterium 14752]
MLRTLFLLGLVVMMWSCVNQPKSETSKPTEQSKPSAFKIDYAKGFEVQVFEGYKLLTITEAWPNADKTFTYLLQESEDINISSLGYDYKIKVPIKSLVVTSTTHIPALEALGVLDLLVGFPNTDYISSDQARSLIDQGEIKNVGQDQNLNTELLLSLQPDVLVSFAVKGQNKSVESIKKANIPVLYNADWVESHPLGKAEWIKFFGLLFGKNDKAQQIFNTIKTEYEKAKTLASESQTKPTVISGALWKDQWYLPGGNSWQAQLIADAHAEYLYAETDSSGSLSLSLESVLNDSQNAEYWIAPAQFTSYQQMSDQQKHYEKFKAFENKNIYTFAKAKGQTGGVLYYELAPQRPDWVLKDLIQIFHPELLTDYEPKFFKPLD